MSLAELTRNVVTRARGLVTRASRRADRAEHPLDVVGREEWHDLLPFRTHRIRLASARYTTAVGVDPEVDVRTELVVEAAGGDLNGRSVIDLGCLEGGFALEFARRGAEPVLGIEFREVSVRRCELARDLMGLDASFVCGDVMTAIPDDARYDVVFAAGILYHLDRPAELLARLRRACAGFLLLDTHVADRDRVTHDCSPEVELPALRGEPYRGRWFPEFSDESTASQRDEMLWASSTNPRSFWPYEDELRRMLDDAGFTSVVPVTDVDRSRWQVDQTNRVLYLCRP